MQLCIFEVYVAVLINLLFLSIFYIADFLIKKFYRFN